MKENNPYNNRGITMLERLLTRYYKKEAAEKEREVVEKWDPEMGEEADVRLFGKDRDTDRIWKAVTAELGFPDAEPKRKGRILKILPVRYAAAAVILLMLGGGLYFANSIRQAQYQLSQKMYYHTDDSMKSITLSDGSVIRLNNNTKLAIVESDFNKEKREVWLEEGEAFFEVAKNPEKPFIVHSHDLETIVKGTSFNVKAYAELDETSVAVRSGKVEVRSGASLLGILTKNKQIKYDKKTNTFEQQQANWEDAAAWMENRLVIKRAGAKELKLRLQQHFGVEVELKGNALQGKTLSCSFRSEVSLQEVLEGISIYYGIKYDMSNPRKIVLYE